MPPFQMDYKLPNPKSQRNTQYINFRNVLQKCVNYSAGWFDEDGSSDEVSEGGAFVSTSESVSSSSDVEDGSNVSSFCSSTGGIWTRLVLKIPPKNPPTTPKRIPSTMR